MFFSYLAVCLPIRIFLLPLIVHFASDRHRDLVVLFLILIELGFASAHLWREIEDVHWCRPLHTVIFGMAAALVEIHAPSLLVTFILLLSPILGAMTSAVFRD